MKRLMILMILLLVSRGAVALNITMIPLQSTSVVPGQSFSFDIVWDWSSDPDLLVYGGGFDIFFETAALEFVGVSVDYVGDPQFHREPELVNTGGTYWLLDTWAVGDFAGMPVSGRFGTVHFVVRDTMPSTSIIWAQDVPTTGPPWVCAGDPLCFILPEYNQLVLTRVPAPPALALFASALLVLASSRRRKA